MRRPLILLGAEPWATVNGRLVRSHIGGRGTWVWNGRECGDFSDGWVRESHGEAVSDGPSLDPAYIPPGSMKLTAGGALSALFSPVTMDWEHSADPEVTELARALDQLAEAVAQKPPAGENDNHPLQAALADFDAWYERSRHKFPPCPLPDLTPAVLAGDDGSDDVMMRRPLFLFSTFDVNRSFWRVDGTRVHLLGFIFWTAPCVVQFSDGGRASGGGRPLAGLNAWDLVPLASWVEHLQLTSGGDLLSVAGRDVPPGITPRGR